MVDGTGAPARARRRRDRRRRIVAIGDGLDGDAVSSTPTGRVVDARLHRHPHPLRRAGVLGPGAHAVVLARRHVGRRRQLRLLDRAEPARAPRLDRAHARTRSRTCRRACSKPASTGTSRPSPSTSHSVERRGTVLNFGVLRRPQPGAAVRDGRRGLRARGDPRGDRAHAAVVADSDARRARSASPRASRANHRGDGGLPVPSRNGRRRRVRGAGVGARRARLRRVVCTRRASPSPTATATSCSPRIGRPLMWTPMLDATR